MHRFLAVLSWVMVMNVCCGGLLSRTKQQDGDVASAYGETWNSFYGKDVYYTLFNATLDERSDGAPNIVADQQNGILTATIRLSVNDSTYNAWKDATHKRLATSGLHFKIASFDADIGRVIGGKNYVFEENDEAAIKRWEQKNADYTKQERAEKAIHIVVRLVDAKGKIIREGDILMEKFRRVNGAYDAQRPFYKLNRLKDLPETRFNWKGNRGNHAGGNPNEYAIAGVEFTGLSGAEMDSIEEVKCEVKALVAFNYDRCVEGGVSYCFYEQTKSWVAESCEKNAQGDVAVLGQLKGYKVTRINSSAFSNRDGVTKITVADGVEIIGNGAFQRCPKLEEVMLPDSVTNLGENAFSECSMLSKIALPKNLTCIEHSVFSDCNALKSVTIPAHVATIKSSAFGRCNGLEEVTIPASVTHIGDEAFHACKGLQRVTLPVGLRYLGKEAFRDCSTLGKVMVAGDVATQLNEPVAKPCGRGVSPRQKEEKSSSFRRGETPRPRSRRGQPPQRERRNGIANGTRFENRYGVGEYAFRDCIELTEVTIPGSVIELGPSMFCDCKALKTVTIQMGIECIAKHVFWDLPRLTLVKLPSTLREIGDGVFDSCPLLSEIKIPDGVESIGTRAFNRCDSIERLTIPDSVKTIGQCAFNCKKLTKITIPATLQDYEGAFYRNNGLKEVIFAEGVTKIPRATFMNCSNLTRLTIPSSMKTIEYAAFEGCRKLTQVTVPNSVTEIGKNAFPRDTKIIRK